MAVKFEDLKEQVLIVLYDYMLTSDHEAFFFSIRSIREGLAPNVAGAFVKRALDVLVDDDLVEQGISDPEGEPADTVTYALSDSGIGAVEEVLIGKGWNLADYEPSPTVDRIISRAAEPELHTAIQHQIAAVAQELRKSNEASAILGDEKDVVADELATASEISSKERFRITRLSAYILPTLRFIGSKFIGSALGEAAKHLADLLMKLS